MIRRLLETLAVVVAAVGLVLAVTAFSPAALPRTTRVSPPQDTKSVCVPTDGVGVVFATDAEGIGVLGEPARRIGEAVLLPDQEEPVVLTGSRTPVGGYLNAIGSAKSWTPCTAPLAEGILLVPSAANTELRIVNSDRTDAAVDLTIRGPGGDVAALGSRGIAVSAESVRTIALSVLADVEGPVSIEYRTSRGRATVVARTRTPAALESATTSQPATDHLLAGIPAGAGNATVLLANPGDERASVRVQALGATTNYTPVGGDGISVPPGSTLAVPLGTSLAGEASALRVTSDVAVGASLVTGTAALDPAGGVDSEQAFVAPAESGPQLAAFVQAGGVLQVSSPSGEATVRVADTVGGTTTETELLVPAGGTATLPLSTDAPQGHVVTVTADTAVVGAVVFVDGSGAAVVPMQARRGGAADLLAAELDPTLN